jgi:hypothetical protein
MPRRNVRCPNGHYIQVEIGDGYTTAKVIPQGGNYQGSRGHNQVCPICNRMLSIEYAK